MLKLLILSIVIVGFAVLALAIKMFFIKGATFSKTCASFDEKGNKVPCSCKSTGEDKCENYEKHHGNAPM